jgi:hypothetical protein
MVVLNKSANDGLLDLKRFKTMIKAVARAQCDDGRSDEPARFACAKGNGFRRHRVVVSVGYDGRVASVSPATD